jgi:hypothetical protein
VGLAVLLASVAAQEHERKFWPFATQGARTKVSTTDPRHRALIAGQRLASRATLNSQAIH